MHYTKTTYWKNLCSYVRKLTGCLTEPGIFRTVRTINVLPMRFLFVCFSRLKMWWVTMIIMEVLPCCSPQIGSTHRRLISQIHWEGWQHFLVFFWQSLDVWVVFWLYDLFTASPVLKSDICNHELFIIYLQDSSCGFSSDKQEIESKTELNSCKQ